MSYMTKPNVKLEITEIGGLHNQVGRPAIITEDAGEAISSLSGRFNKLSRSTLGGIVESTAQLMSVDMGTESRRDVDLTMGNKLEGASDWQDKRCLFRLTLEKEGSRYGYLDHYIYTGWADRPLSSNGTAIDPETTFVINNINKRTLRNNALTGGDILERETNQVIPDFSGTGHHGKMIRPSDILAKAELSVSESDDHGDLHDLDVTIIDSSALGKTQMSNRVNQSPYGYSHRMFSAKVGAKNLNQNKFGTGFAQDKRYLTQEIDGESVYRDIAESEMYVRANKLCDEAQYEDDYLRGLIETECGTLGEAGNLFTYQNLEDVFGERELDNATHLNPVMSGELVMSRPDTLAWDEGNGVNDADMVLREIGTILKNAVIGIMHDVNLSRAAFIYSNKGDARDPNPSMYGGNAKDGMCERVPLAAHEGIMQSAIASDPSVDFMEAEDELYGRLIREVMSNVTKGGSRPLTVQFDIDFEKDIRMDITYDNYPIAIMTGAVFIDATTTNMVTTNTNSEAAIITGFKNMINSIEDNVDESHNVSRGGLKPVRGTGLRSTNNSNDSTSSFAGKLNPLDL